MAYNTDFVQGEKFYWKRQGELLECTALEIKTDPDGKQHATLAVEGWVGTHWTALDSIVFKRKCDL